MRYTRAAFPRQHFRSLLLQKQTLNRNAIHARIPQPGCMYHSLECLFAVLASYLGEQEGQQSYLVFAAEQERTLNYSTTAEAQQLVHQTQTEYPWRPRGTRSWNIKFCNHAHRYWWDAFVCKEQHTGQQCCGHCLTMLQQHSWALLPEQLCFKTNMHMCCSDKSCNTFTFWVYASITSAAEAWRVSCICRNGPKKYFRARAGTCLFLHLHQVSLQTRSRFALLAAGQGKQGTSCQRGSQLTHHLLSCPSAHTHTAGVAPGTAPCSWAHQRSTPPTGLPFPSFIAFHLSCSGYSTIRILLLAFFYGREPEWPLEESQSERKDLHDTDSNLPHRHSVTVKQLFPCWKRNNPSLSLPGSRNVNGQFRESWGSACEAADLTAHSLCHYKKS